MDGAAIAILLVEEGHSSCSGSLTTSGFQGKEVRWLPSQGLASHYVYEARILSHMQASKMDPRLAWKQYLRELCFSSNDSSDGKTICS